MKGKVALKLECPEKVIKVSVIISWEGGCKKQGTLGTSMVKVAFDADIRIEGNLLAISLMLFYFLVSHANGQTVWNSQQQPDMFTKKETPQQ